jgi:hypothetical protein
MAVELTHRQWKERAIATDRLADEGSTATRLKTGARSTLVTKPGSIA